MADLRKSGEDYLETILILKNQIGVVHSIDIANCMNFSKPSVSRAVGILKEEGYLLMAENGELTLTDKGTAAAEHIYERHQVLTAMLVNLGVPEEIAAEDACQVEHVISDTSFEHIKQHFREEHQRDAAGGKKKDGKDKKKKKKG